MKRIGNSLKIPIIREAIFLASPSLYEEMERWLKGNLEEKKIPKFKTAFLKYLTRMMSRCTPFGLFAGCSVGKIGEETSIQLKGAQANNRHTRLDMNYLVALSQVLSNHPVIKKQLLFSPNSSLYPVGDQLRYVEYKYVNSQRHHHIAEVQASDYLLHILDQAETGACLKDLANELVDEEISYEEAEEFIEELIDNQILVSELEPSVSGPEFLEQIYTVLRKLDGVDDLIAILQNTENRCRQIDQKIGNSPDVYIELSEYLRQLDTDFELKYMFQTDLVVETQDNQLSKSTVETVKKGMALLNRLSLPPKRSFMNEFKEAFYERFEEREVGLAQALDVETGIGYRQDQSSDDIDPLLKGLDISGPAEKHPLMEVKWNRLDDIFHQKLIKAWKEGVYSIQLEDKDFEDFEADWETLPDTISLTLEVLKINGEEKVRLRGGGGSGAACLLGRFGHSDPEMLDYIQQIVETEEKINAGKLMAEIVHLPESRVGNVLMRPVLRKYEIPYLARSILDKEHQLGLNDLCISVRNASQVRLRSKQYNKEVIPRLTNAHNFITNALPIYHFLGDLQINGLRDGINLHLGPFSSDYDFVPRIEYRNLILRSASWNIKKEQITAMIGAIDDTAQLKAAIATFRQAHKMPVYCMLADGDNELLINFDNLSSCRMLLNTVKKREQFRMTEFLFTDTGVVKGSREGEFYTHQVAMSFYHSQKLNSSRGANN